MVPVVLCWLASLPIPKGGYDKLTLTSTQNATLFLDVYLDMACTDCAAAAPTLEKLAKVYPTQLQLNLHLFPLPYHRYAFDLAKSTHVVYQHTNKSAQKLWMWMDLLFAHQVKFEPPPMNLTKFQVDHLLSSLSDSSGIVAHQSMMQGLMDEDVDSATRASWKYGAARGVSGTPTFFVNGVVLDSALPYWTVADWRRILDTLV